MGRRLRYPDLVERGYYNNKTTLRNHINAGLFPPGKLTGPNCRTWDEDEDIGPWLASRPVDAKAVPKSPGRPRRNTAATDHKARA